MIKNTSFEYIEFGKKYSDYDASDFEILDHSSETILDIAGRVRCERFLDIGLRFPAPASKTPFSLKVPNISISFIRPSEEYYLFVQIQRRQEGDWAVKNGNNPRLNRPFNHVRFTYIELKNINDFVNLFEAKSQGYFSLLYKNHTRDNFGEDDYALKDYYKTGGGLVPFSIVGIDHQYSVETNHIRILTNILMDTFIKEDSLNVQVLGAPINDWKIKLLLITEVQKLLLSSVGFFTFALDHISERTDINLYFFEQPTISGVREVKWENAFDRDYHKEIIELSKKPYHQELVGSAKLVKEYLLPQMSILEAVEVVCVLKNSKYIHEIDVFSLVKKPSLFLLLAEKKRLEEFLNNARFSYSQIGDLLLYDLPFEPSSLAILLKKFIEDPKNYDENLTVLVTQKHSSIIEDSRDFLDLFSRKIGLNRLSRQDEFDEKLRFLLFQFKASDQEKWADVYLSLSQKHQKELSPELANWYDRYYSFLNKSYDSNQRRLIYEVLIEYLTEIELLFESRLFVEWVPRKDLMLDKILSQKLISNDKLFEDALEKIILQDEFIKFEWLLQECPLSDQEILRVLVFVVKMSKGGAGISDAKLKMHDFCMKIIIKKGLGPEKYYQIESEFYIEVFSVSPKTEDWFFENVLPKGGDEIIDFLNALLDSDDFDGGVNFNPDLGILLQGEVLDVIKIQRQRNLENSFLLSLLAVRQSDQVFASELVSFFVKRLPRKEDNEFLSEVLKRGLCKDTSPMVAVNWLMGTRTRQLRNAYILHGVDSLRKFIQPFLINDDILVWEFYVTDILALFPENFDWQMFTKSLIPSGNKVPKYRRFVEIVRILDDPRFLDMSLYQLRIQVCSDLAKYQSGELNKSELVNLHSYYQNSNIQDKKLKDIIRNEFYEMLTEEPPRTKTSSDILMPSGERRNWQGSNNNLGQNTQGQSQKEFGEKASVLISLAGIALVFLCFIVVAIYRLLVRGPDDISFAVIMFFGIGLSIVAIVIYYWVFEK